MTNSGASARQRMLERIREAVRLGNRLGGCEEPGPHGKIAYQGSASPDLAEGFGQALLEAGGQFHRVANLADVPRVILPILENAGARRIGISAEPLLQEVLQLPRRLHAFGLGVWNAATLTESDRDRLKDTLFSLDAGITGVDALVAETGTVVLAANRNRPRSLSLLPRLYIAVASKEQVIPDWFDWFDAKPDSWPSAYTWITGPSKTGDIELTLVTGVHGPGEVHVVLFDAQS